MKEVSCRVIPCVRYCADQVGIPFDQLARNLPYPPDHFENLRNRIDWDHYALILERLMETCSESRIVELGEEAYADIPSMAAFMGSLSGYFTSLKMFYRFMSRFAVPSMHTNLILRHEGMSGNRVRVTIEIPPHYRDSHAFLVASQGAIAAVPHFMGLPSAIVDAHIEPRRGVYTVRLPPPATIPARLRRTFKALFAGRAAVAELHSQYLEMAREHSQMTELQLGFRQIIERMPNGVIVLRNDRIVYANRVILNALGEASYHALSGRSLQDCVIEQDVPALENAIQNGSNSELPTEVRFSGRSHPLIMQVHFVKGIQFGGQESDVLIAHDVTENRRLEKDIIDAASHEQQRLSHEMHDGLVQLMASVGYRGDVIIERLRRAESPQSDALAEIMKMNREAMKEARDIARRADPVLLNRDGLPSALRDLADSMSISYAVNCTFRPDIAEGGIEHDAALHLYRIAQEAVSNAVRHGDPKTVLIELLAQEQSVVLRVSDDGTGIPQETHSVDGMGLRNMQYRARMIGATFAIVANSPHGTVVTCTLPDA